MVQFVRRLMMASGLPWGLALASGVNTYLPLFLLAVFARFTHVVRLSSRFHFLVSDQALVILGALAACEILAQKFPGLDNVWDFVHTLLRPLAGAVAAGATITGATALELVAAMLVGATLSTAAHSAKSSVRLASTTKTFGAANVLVSFGEDAAVVGGTLLSLYAPWIMLGIVVLFAAAFAWYGPRLARAALFELSFVAAWFTWLFRRLARSREPESLGRTMTCFAPARRRELGIDLEPGEELQGAVAGWKRSKRGPRRGLLAITGSRVIVVEHRRLRKHKVDAIAFQEIALARHRNLWFFERIEIVTRENRSITFNLRKTDGRIGAMAAEAIRQAIRIVPTITTVSSLAETGLAAG